MAAPAADRNAAVQEVLTRYRNVGRWPRLHVSIRFRTCPMAEIEAAVPGDGWIGSLGCGNGAFELYMALLSPSRRVLGTDPDPVRIQQARSAASGLPILFEDTDFFAALSSHGVRPRATVINDVLYLVRHPDQERLLKSVLHTLSPGGLLVLKDMDRRPRWKYAWNLLQETLACRVLRLTHAPHGCTHFRDAAGWVRLLEDLGFISVGTRALDRGYPHPHLLITGEKPGGARGR